MASFRHLAAALGSGYAFHGIQAPPGQKTPEFASSIEKLASYYVSELLMFQPEGPYLLGGWSVGSTIALEMAHQLQAVNRQVELIVAFDGAPFNTNSGTSHGSPLYYWKLLRNFPLWVADDLMQAFSARALLRRAWNKGASFGRKTLSGFRDGGKNSGFEVSSFMDTTHYSATQIAFMNSLFRALQRYVPKPYSGRVIVYQARTEPLHHLFEVDRAWRKIASDVDVVRVPGSHVSLIAPPNVQFLAEDLKHRLSIAMKRLPAMHAGG